MGGFGEQPNMEGLLMDCPFCKILMRAQLISVGILVILGKSFFTKRL